MGIVSATYESVSRGEKFKIDATTNWTRISFDGDLIDVKKSRLGSETVLNLVALVKRPSSKLTLDSCWQSTIVPKDTTLCKLFSEKFLKYACLVSTVRTQGIVFDAYYHFESVGYSYVGNSETLSQFSWPFVKPVLIVVFFVLVAVARYF